MTNEERDIIAAFIARVAGAAPAPVPPGGMPAGSVPATATPAPLPPVEPEAAALIGQLFARYPEAPYRITQLAFVQEHALAEAQNRIRQMEWALQQAQQAQQVQQAPQPGGGFFSGLFGGRPAGPGPGPQGPVWNQGAPGAYPQQAYAQPGYAPPPQYAPGYQPGMFQRGGSGFLGSALTTAAGVAGGMVVGNMLMDMFSPHRGLGGGFGGMPMAGNPWGGGAMPDPGGQGAIDQGAWTVPDNSAGGADPGWGGDPNAGGADPSGGWGNDPGNADPGGGDWGSADPSGGDAGGDWGGGGSDDDTII